MTAVKGEENYSSWHALNLFIIDKLQSASIWQLKFSFNSAVTCYHLIKNFMVSLMYKYRLRSFFCQAKDEIHQYMWIFYTIITSTPQDLITNNPVPKEVFWDSLSVFLLKENCFIHSLAFMHNTYRRVSFLLLYYVNLVLKCTFYSTFTNLELRKVLLLTWGLISGGGSFPSDSGDPD